MKKVLTLLLVAVMLLGLCACGGNSNNPTPANPDPGTEATDTIKIGIFQPASGDNGSVPSTPMWFSPPLRSTARPTTWNWS